MTHLYSTPIAIHMFPLRHAITYLHKNILEISRKLEIHLYFRTKFHETSTTKKVYVDVT